jgi:Putative restriction endonuclease
VSTTPTYPSERATKRRVARWPPDDTEESVVGISLHQTTIRIVTAGINEAAQGRRRAGEPLSWEALSQTILLGCERPDGSPLRTMPDTFVMDHETNPLAPSLRMPDDGVPLLVIEVLSRSTQGSDLDLTKGKGFSYARAGIREYLTLDPTGEWIPEQIKGWRLNGGGYKAVRTGSDGRWHCETVPVSFGFQGLMAAVYTKDGEPILREGEVSVWARRMKEETRIAEERAQETIAQLREEIAELRRRREEN